MKKFSTTLFLIFSCNCLIAQITFQKIYKWGTGYNRGYNVQQTSDEGYIISGFTTIPNTNDIDAYLIKTNSYGDTIWTRTFGAASGIERGNSVRETNDGGFIISGIAWSPGTSIYLIKIDANGDSMWTKTFDGFSTEEGNEIQQTTDKGYIITGYTASFGAGDLDFYLLKTDSIGNLLWSKTYGGQIADFANSVQQTSDGGYIMTGYMRSFGAGDADVCLIKTDSTGNLMWTKTYGGLWYDEGKCVRQTTDDGYIITGYTNSFSSGADQLYLIKTDTTGNLQWSKVIGGGAVPVGFYGYSVQQIANGGYIVCGHIAGLGAGYSNAYLVRTDVNGNTLWTKMYNALGFGWGDAVQQTSDNGYVISGVTDTLLSGNHHVYLIKTDSLGNSGCSQKDTVVPISSPPSQVTSPVITVSPAPFINANFNTIVRSGGIVNSVCMSVGIESANTDASFRISIFPNPVNYKLNFFLYKMTNIILTNLIGEIILEKTMNGKVELDVSFLSAGIYFIKAENEVGKFVKE